MITKSTTNLVALVDLFKQLNSYESVKIVIEALGDNLYLIISDAYSFNFFSSSFEPEKKACITNFLMGGASSILQNEVDFLVLSKNVTLTQWRAALRSGSLSIKTIPEVCSLLNHLKPGYAHEFLSAFYDDLKGLIVRPNDKLFEKEFK